jgi:septum formation protein
MTDLSIRSIVLASQSASRKAMLTAAGVAFEAVGVDLDERRLEAEMEEADPAEVAQALAAAKAVAVTDERRVMGGVLRT